MSFFKSREFATAIVVIIIIGVLIFASMPLLYFIPSGGGYRYFGERFSITSSTQFEPKANIYIDTINGRISLCSWDGSKVKLEWTKHAPSSELLDRLNVDISEFRDRVEIKTDFREMSFGNYGGNYGIDYALFLPEGEMNELSLETTNGMIEVMNIYQPSRLSARSSNGGIVIENTSVDDVSIGTTNSKITIENSRAENISAESTNGGIEAHLTGMGNVSLKTTNGKIELSIPEYKDFRIEARTTNGRIDFGISSPLIVEEVSRNKFVGYVLPIRYEIKLRTTNGGIEIE
ncbi:MAG TPA: DUF4097 domain-containing protein [Thermoplasmata archaeon]|nr:DUF4097 domain-containing protein [Thermoplasmata archaeon]